MKSGLVAVALALCLGLAGCFTSEKPLFDDARGVALLGRGSLDVTTYKEGETPESGRMEWRGGLYEAIDDGEEDGKISFHHLPGSGWFSPWYVGQTALGKDEEGFLYILYRKDGPRLYSYDVGCSDLTPQEAAATHMERSASGQECHAARAADLGKALLLLSKRKQADAYMTAEPAK